MVLRLIFAAALSCAAITAACAETGLASFYGGKHHGGPTASGVRYNQWSDTCAHKSFPFGTRLRVWWRGNSVECVVRDRGPFKRGRVVDLSVAGARTLKMEAAGVVPVIVEVIR